MNIGRTCNHPWLHDLTKELPKMEVCRPYGNLYMISKKRG